MESLGSCVLANDNPFRGQAGDIFQRRINGESWANIAKAYELGSPAAARNLFKKLTGVSDFKIKGPELIKLAKGGVPTPPKVIKAKKLGDPKPADEIADLVTFSDKIYKPVIPSPGSYEGIVELYKSGYGYLDISKFQGIPINKVDEVVRHHLLAKNNGNVWKAWKEKPNSEHLTNDLRATVHKARKQGLEVDEIVKHMGIDEGVVDDILKGKFNPLPPQVKFVPKPIKPAAPKEPPKNINNPTTSKVGKKLEANFDEFPKATNELLDRIHSPSQLPPVTRVAVEHYTGSTYRDINGALRGKSERTTRVNTLINGMDRAMTPLKQNISLTRGMNKQGLQMGEISGDAVLALKGKVISDPGYLSTSTKPVFGGGGVRMNLEVPAGAKGVWAKPLSLHGETESEFILARDTRIMITAIERTDKGTFSETWTVVGRVIV